MPLACFDDLVMFLHDRIDRTQLGRINRWQGHQELLDTRRIPENVRRGRGRSGGLTPSVDPRQPVIHPPAQSGAGWPVPTPRHFLDSRRLAEVRTDICQIQAGDAGKHVRPKAVERSEGYRCPVTTPHATQGLNYSVV